MTDTAVVRVEERGAVLVITLDRPAKRNAVSAQMTRELDAAFNRFDDDSALRVAVLAANGPVFCAGSDLGDGPGEPSERGGEYGFIRRRLTKPVIAALEGPAIGGGFELVMACDFVVAAEPVTFSLPEATRGRVANAGGLFRTFDRLPRNVALELLVAGAHLGAARAHSLGFVNRLCSPGKALSEALVLAGEICGSAPSSIVEVMSAVHTFGAATEIAGWDATGLALMHTLDTEERAEGSRAFFERRRPNWSPARTEV